MRQLQDLYEQYGTLSLDQIKIFSDRMAPCKKPQQRIEEESKQEAVLSGSTGQRQKENAPRFRKEQKRPDHDTSQLQLAQAGEDENKQKFYVEFFDS